MLYLDSSALVKFYAKETGSDLVSARCRSGELILTSALSYAEVLAALARKCREGEIRRRDFASARDRFHSDWHQGIKVIAVDNTTMAHVPALVEAHSIKGSDAVHLSAAIWARDFLVRPAHEPYEFGVSDLSLSRIASSHMLAVLNPEQP